MLLLPAKMKFKKYQKQRRRFIGLSCNYCYPKRGFFGLKSLTSRRIKSAHIEAVRRFVQRRIKKRIKEKLQICIFPDLPVTQKSSGVRMGKGKGSIEFWVTPIFSGRILFELGKKILQHDASSILRRASKKLPVKSKFIIRKQFHFC